MRAWLATPNGEVAAILVGFIGSGCILFAGWVALCMAVLS